VIPPVEPAPGARLGLVTLEDVIEELIGEIRDATRRRPSTDGATADRTRSRTPDVTRRKRREA
jgi:CBS domain containing-hemolysin-like protein